MEHFAPFRAVERALIAPAGLEPGDLDLLINYRPAIPPAPPAVETLLSRPGAIDSLVPALRRDLQSADAESAPLWRWLGDSAAPGPRDDAPWPLVLERALRAYLAPLSAGEVDYLRREAPALLRASAEDTALDPWQAERERLRGEAVTDSVMRLAARLPKARLAEAARALDDGLAALRDAARRGGADGVEAYLREGPMRWGVPVSFGGDGDDAHALDRGIVFDRGGDDRYQFPDTVRPGSWLLVLDLSGKDVYAARDTVGAAAGFLSLQLLADLAGNDRYEGVDFAFGAAVLGYARLHDAGGDDVYEARCASLGFAFHGIGILHDADGRDTYSTAYLSQGAAATGGLALLRDDAGDDRYVSRPVYPDDLRYRDKFLSLSQGFSTGFAPRHAGGIGILWDRAGDDVYVSDIFGQGTGYWFAWGLLMDDAGNDTARAYQYAQGSGVHFAVGTFLEGGGHDVRVSKGVSQGCGHDGGFGLLADFSGNDSTVATDMSTGGGNANGLGMYVDFGGRDAYAMGNPRMTLGHADMRRDRGSYAFFLDLDDEAAPDALPPELPAGKVRRVYDGDRRGNGYGVSGELGIRN